MTVCFFPPQNSLILKASQEETPSLHVKLFFRVCRFLCFAVPPAHLPPPPPVTAARQAARPAGSSGSPAAQHPAAPSSPAMSRGGGLRAHPGGEGSVLDRHQGRPPHSRERGGGGCGARNGLPSLMRDVAKTLPNLKENRNKESSEWPCLLTNKSLIMVTQKLAHSGWGYIPVHKLSSENIQSWKCTKHIYPTARHHVAQPTSHVLRIIPLAHGGANHPTATVQHSQRGSHHLLMAQQRNEIQKAKYSTY